jgi:hypothetical protein
MQTKSLILEKSTYSHLGSKVNKSETEEQVTDYRGAVSCDPVGWLGGISNGQTNAEKVVLPLSVDSHL